jgi:phosphoglucomutase
VKRIAFSSAINALRTHQVDFVLPYVKDLENVVDIPAIRNAGVKPGADPLGAARPYWSRSTPFMG